MHWCLPKVVFRDAAQDVERQVRARVAHVAGVVHRGAAGVPQHLVAVRRAKLFELPRERVVDLIKLGKWQRQRRGERASERVKIQSQKRLESYIRYLRTVIHQSSTRVASNKTTEADADEFRKILTLKITLHNFIESSMFNLQLRFQAYCAK